MFVILLCAVINYFIISWLEKKHNGHLEGFQCAAFVIVPAILLVIINIVVAAFDLPLLIGLMMLSLYFIIPLLMSRLQAEYSWGRSAAYGGITFGVVTGISLLFELFLFPV